MLFNDPATLFTDIAPCMRTKWHPSWSNVGNIEENVKSFCGGGKGNALILTSKLTLQRMERTDCTSNDLLNLNSVEI